MNLVAVGLSHHTAPVEVREQLALGPAAGPELLQRLRDDAVGAEAVLLSTCNRVELYVVANRGQSARDVADWLALTTGRRSRSVGRHLFAYDQQDALRQVFRVAASLDSMIIGEPQIVGQLREAYKVATSAHAAGPVMRRVMDRALHVAKRVRSETDIAREAVSVGRAGVELARQVLGSLSGRSALLIGAGAHGKLVATSMIGYGLGELIVANRTFDRAAELAQKFGGTAAHLDDIERHLDRVDVVVASTGAGRLLVTRAQMARVVRRRRYRSQVLLDLSVPRNIDPSINDLDGAYRFDVDDLREVAAQGKAKRQQAAQVAEDIVRDEAEKAWVQIRAEQHRDALAGVMRRAETIRSAEVERAQKILHDLTPKQKKAVDAMTRAILKKVLHPAMQHTRSWAEDGDLVRLEAALLALGVTPSDSESSS